MGTLKVNGDIHATNLALNGDWENNFGIRFREGGTSNDYGAYIMYGANDAFTFGTRDSNIDLTAFSIPRTGNTVTFYGDIVMTSPKVIYANSILPNDTNTHIIGAQNREYASGYLRQIFTRHIEPATNINNDVYICYNNRGGVIRCYAPLDMCGIGSIHNLPIGGGIYWYPYIESSADSTDACGIHLIQNGCLGGTELCMYANNDATDCINLHTPSWICLRGKATFRVDDSWLRINETLAFGSGIYFGGSVVRTDNQFQVGSDGSAFVARSDGYGRFSKKLDIGSQVSIWEDNEGGNIWLHSGNGHVNAWEIDSYNGDLRIYTWRESDGGYRGNVLHQTDGYWDNCYWASSAGNADTVDGVHSSSMFLANGWWDSGNSGYSCDSVGNGMVFAYTGHGVPDCWGTLCTFGYGSGRDYNLQLHGSGYNQLFYRNRSADFGQGGWRRVVDDSNYHWYALPLSGGTLSGQLTINANVSAHFNGRTDISCLCLTNEEWTGYGTADPEGNLTAVVGRVYFQII